MTNDGPLTARTIMRFYMPLALSWLFMGLEAPVCMAVISHLPNAEVNAAAFFIMMSLSMWIESPIIDLLATSTTLAKDRQRLATITEFVWWLMVWVTAVHSLFVFTPIFYLVVEGVMGIKHEVAAAARGGMGLLCIWSASIAWRRYLQGVLIRSGLTRIIGFGTLTRVLTIGATSLVLFLTTKWSGVVITALSLMVSVAVETLFVHVVSRPVVRELNAREPEPGEAPLTMRRLAAFHFPLSLTTLVKLLVFPIIGAGLARVDQPVLVTAAYQLAGSIIFLHRAIGFCLPEVVITLYKDEEARMKLKRFCLGVAGCTLGSMLFLSLTKLDMLIFVRVLGAKQEVAEQAHLVFLLSAAVPFLDAIQSYVRGVLTAHHLTVSRLAAVAVSVSVLAGMVVLGVALRWSGPVVAASALTGSLTAELGVLVWSWSRSQARIGELATQGS